jgi:hypothetical protein
MVKVASINDGWDLTIDKEEYTNSYKDFCKLASIDDKVFSSFKSNPIYQSVVGCDSHGEQTARMFLNYIIENYEPLIQFLPKFGSCDEVGSPPRYSMGDCGNFSPNILRYIKVVGDIKKYFGSMDSKEVVEIGGGYGGQFKALQVLNRFKSYTHIDCEEALMLTERYISEFDDIDCDLNFYNLDSIKVNNYDLCISDSALSEMNSEIFDLYLKKILSNSTNAYCTMNDYYRKDESVEKFKKIFDEVEVIPDRPAMNPNNECYILIGKKVC